MITNNVTRFLTTHKIPFEVFELPEEKNWGIGSGTVAQHPRLLDV